jgi:hypothetical protein
LREGGKAIATPPYLKMPEASFCQQIFQASACVSIEVKGHLVLLPSKRCGKEETAAGHKQAMKLLERSIRFR